MKKITTAALALLLTTLTYAHHIISGGWCSDKGGQALYTTVSFANNINVEIEYQPYGSSTWVFLMAYTTPASGVTTKNFGVPQPNQNNVVKCRFRYKKTAATTWGAWSTPVTSTCTLGGNCASLPIHFEYLTVKKIGENLFDVEFKVAEANSVNTFNIQVSNDGMNFKTVTILLPTNEAEKTYQIRIKL